MMELSPGSRIGIIGGGQLGRMMAMSAASLGYKTHIFCPDEGAPATHVSDATTYADYTDLESLKHFASDVDIVTLEFENIPCESVAFLEQVTIVRPGSHVLHIAQNRIREKDFATECKVPTAPYHEVLTPNDLADAVKKIGIPMILKTQEFGYDGKGQWLLRSTDDVASCSEMIQQYADGKWIAEGFIPFEKEISVIAARGIDGTVITYPAVENVHRNGILHETTAPANISPELAVKAKNIATALANRLDVIGLLAVEMFVTPSHDILFNEMAPRPHNSGHWSMDACVTSQFEQAIRAAAGLPFGDISFLCHAKMRNLIGDEIEQWKSFIEQPHAKLHLYGKEEARPGRKMGHVTFLEPQNHDSHRTITHSKVPYNEKTS